MMVSDVEKHRVNMISYDFTSAFLASGIKPSKFAVRCLIKELVPRRGALREHTMQRAPEDIDPALFVMTPTEVWNKKVCGNIQSSSVAEENGGRMQGHSHPIPSLHFCEHPELGTFGDGISVPLWLCVPGADFSGSVVVARSYVVRYHQHKLTHTASHADPYSACDVVVVL